MGFFYFLICFDSKPLLLKHSLFGWPILLDQPCLVSSKLPHPHESVASKDYSNLLAQNRKKKHRSIFRLCINTSLGYWFQFMIVIRLLFFLQVYLKHSHGGADWKLPKSKCTQEFAFCRELWAVGNEEQQCWMRRDAEIWLGCWRPSQPGASYLQRLWRRP